MVRFILLAILLIVIARVFWRVIDAIITASGGTRQGQRRPTEAVKLVRDPVCGTFVAPRAALSLTAGGSTHYFCSDECRREFSRTSQ